MTKIGYQKWPLGEWRFWRKWQIWKAKLAKNRQRAGDSNWSEKSPGPLESGDFGENGDFGDNGKILPEGWRFKLDGKITSLASGNFGEIGDFGKKMAKFGKNSEQSPEGWRYAECGK